MIGVVIPAHNEEARIAAAVSSVLRAAAHPLLQGEPVHVVVVADACADATVVAAAMPGVDVVEVPHRNVGLARSGGADLLLARGARWLAFTDADSIVADDWLVQQLALKAHAVCGCIWVEDWAVHGGHAQQLADAFRLGYTQADGHRHVHGANLGLSAEAYRKAGGFAPLRSDEDVALVRALSAAGVEVVYSAAPRVVTSARADHRTPWGFGASLVRQSCRLEAASLALATCEDGTAPA